jgi:hypothetical protein
MSKNISVYDRFDVEVEDVYGVDGYCQQKECLGGIHIKVYDNVAEKVSAEVDDEECFDYSGYHKKIWMFSLEGVVNDIMGQLGTSVGTYDGKEMTSETYDELKLEVRKQIKYFINDSAIGAWYSEPDYIQGWDDVVLKEEVYN